MQVKIVESLTSSGLAPCLAACLAAGAIGAAVTDNLVLDGGMETWRTTGPRDSGWNYLAVQWQAAEFARDDQGRFLTPFIASQYYDTHVVKPETQDVYTGAAALRLKGQLYLRESGPDAYRTRDGDIYEVRYRVKGEGQSRMHFTIYGDAAVETLEIRGKPAPGGWSLIEERLQVVGRAPTTIFPRLWTSAEMLVDEVSVVRVLRPGERTLEAVAPDLQKRIAFAWPAEAITLDGKLDEPAWRHAVAFGGFRVHGDQSLLVEPQPTFRVLCDEQSLVFGVEVPLPDARQVLDELMRRPLLDADGRPRPKTDTYSGRHSVELFLQAPGQSGYRQLVVSLDGYRYDDRGMDRTWNGDWRFAVQAADDRWLLELIIPAPDLGIPRLAPVDGWRLNLCCNQPDNPSTWAAVGAAFHVPDAFGGLIAQDFATWQKTQPEQWRRRKTGILAAIGARTEPVAARLAAIEAAGLALQTGDSSVDWRAITRTCAQLDYIGSAYRQVEAEVRYTRFFPTP